ncbi:sigma-70 family RNA polymerase sigma factor [Salibacterium qingdaonense]|uniref:RNA polymerase sigma-70 factor, ECF subfamily n=1 Tax=Salibacterium qingdaonense TaxID=266892 RepID=A0A1I4NRZ8_9BACI|nr:sigma-70 family RNA polymerase sigma factor [Salibacterium qingdaonense]SFM18302.1 RNA polymerase sigma-70 factor, ECF subfamily [Salibacterium qingdaonense]
MNHDTGLVQQAMDGEEEAFESLLQSESEKLYFIAMSYVQNKDDALDAIQEAACQAFLSIHQLKKPEFFSTWLVRILIRECYKILKKTQKTVPFEEEKFEEKMADSFKGTTRREARLAEAVDKLEHSQQTAILLFYYHDLPIKQIAEVMEKPEGTVKTYLRRGKDRLKKQIERGECRNEEWA